MKQTFQMLHCQLSNNFIFSKLSFGNSQPISATSVKQSLHPQTEEAGRRGREKETRGRGASPSETGTGAKRKREAEAGGEEAADGATAEDERGGRTKEER